MTTTPKLLQVGFSSRNVEQAATFFEHYLGFVRGAGWISDDPREGALLGLPGARFKRLQLHLGQECLELCEVISAAAGTRTGRPIPADSRSCDLWFQHICLVTSDLEAALGTLQPALQFGQATAVSSGAQTLPAWNTAAAGIRAYKFRDPEGHNLELLQFPADKGEARWHQSAVQGVMLGIDHSAISVANTAASCRFYDELLGLKLGGDGINSGPTQDGLDGLQHTEVRISAHRCSTGAGIECLNYLPPNAGRAMPADLGPQDLAHWQIRLQVADLDSLVDQIEPYGGRLISPGVLNWQQGEHPLGIHRALQVADPDGHRLQLVETD